MAAPSAEQITVAADVEGRPGEDMYGRGVSSLVMPDASLVCYGQEADDLGVILIPLVHQQRTNHA